MNYEELLAAKNSSKKHIIQLPIGGYYREQIDGKWRGVVTVRPELTSNIAFTKALKNECERNQTLPNHRQIHFTPESERGDIRQLILESGNFQTFDQVLIDNPAIVAEKGFLERLLTSLVEVTTYLHKQGIKHVCYSPRTVFMRKGDDGVMLLTHGEFYLGIKDQNAFYGDDAKYVAPEVLDHGTVDERCDVYGIARFIEAVFDQSDVPFEYRDAFKKATSVSPEARFSTPEEMLKAIQKRRSTMRSVLSFVAASIVALLCVAVYFDMMPESTPVEFVKPAPRQPTDDLIDDGFNPEELGVVGEGDSLVVDEESLRRDYQAKAEEIFRKKYEKEADRILSKIYNNSYMGNNEKKFMSESQSTLDELMKVQNELGQEAGLTSERSQLLATEIIERVSNQKKKSLKAPNTGNGQ